MVGGADTPPLPSRALSILAGVDESATLSCGAAVVWPLQAAYKRRLRAIVGVAPA